MEGNHDFRIDLAEIGRHIAAQMDEKVGNPRSLAIHLLGGEYIEQHREDFDIKKGGQAVFTGGDSTKMGIPEDYGEDDSEDEDNGKMTFSMSEGPPSDD